MISSVKLTPLLPVNGFTRTSGFEVRRTHS